MADDFEMSFEHDDGHRLVERLRFIEEIESPGIIAALPPASSAMQTMDRALNQLRLRRQEIAAVMSEIKGDLQA